MINWEPLLFRVFRLGKPKQKADERTRTAHLLITKLILRILCRTRARATLLSRALNVVFINSRIGGGPGIIAPQNLQ